LKNPEVLSKEIISVGDSIKITEKLRFKRQIKKDNLLKEIISFTFNTTGWLNIEYNFTPVERNRSIFRSGVSFVIPRELFSNVMGGDGPFPSYPDKIMLDEFGIFQKANEDLYFQGNRRRVDAALFTNKVGSGLLLVSNGDDVAVENIPEGILIQP
jgi:hypothetical protein